MKENEINELHSFLSKNGVAEEDLPTLMVVSKLDAISIVSGCKKKATKTKFYFCVCNSGHFVNCKELKIFYSGWKIRVSGNNVFLLKDKIYKFNLASLPHFKNIYFIASKRSKIAEVARNRVDILCVSNDRQKFCNRIKTRPVKKKNI